MGALVVARAAGFWEKLQRAARFQKCPWGTYYVPLLRVRVGHVPLLPIGVRALLLCRLSTYCDGVH